MKHPRLTVLMPAYNADRYIGVAIASVLSQSFGDFELLIIDDGSTDGTAGVVQAFRDSRIRYRYHTNQGIAGALNHGLTLARTELIVRFDADDICLPDRLHQQIRFMDTHPEYVLMGSMVDYMDMDGRYVFTYKPPALSNEAIRRLPDMVCPFIHSSVIYRKTPVMELGGYPFHAHGFEDHLLWRGLLQKGKVHNLEEVLLQVRFNPGSVTMEETCRDPAYRAIKRRAIRSGGLTPEEGQRLLYIMQQQNRNGEKQAAYHVLLAKKYLWNNPQPLKARMHALIVLRQMRFPAKSFVLWLLSYLPAGILPWIYRKLHTSSYVPSQL
jgi:glycosyltransferase involved in cell wall biosynthesis